MLVCVMLIAAMITHEVRILYFNTRVLAPGVIRVSLQIFYTPAQLLYTLAE